MELTKLERAVIERLAETQTSKIPDFEQHVPHIRVLERDMTGVGFYTKIASSRGPLSRQNGKVEAGSARNPNQTTLLSFILWLDEDGTCVLEGFTAEDHWPADADEFIV